MMEQKYASDVLIWCEYSDSTAALRGWSLARVEAVTSEGAVMMTLILVQQHWFN